MTEGIKPIRDVEFVSGESRWKVSISEDAQFLRILQLNDGARNCIECSREELAAIQAAIQMLMFTQSFPALFAGRRIKMRRHRKPNREQLITANYQLLRDLVAAAIACGIADSWKGSGDPYDVTVLEADYAAAKARVESQIMKLEREALANG